MCFQKLAFICLISQCNRIHLLTHHANNQLGRNYSKLFNKSNLVAGFLTYMHQ